MLIHVVKRKKKYLCCLEIITNVNKCKVIVVLRLDCVLLLYFHKLTEVRCGNMMWLCQCIMLGLRLIS